MTDAPIVVLWYHQMQIQRIELRTCIRTEEGEVHTFTPKKTRYLRVNILKNSVNLGVHIVELWAYESEKEKQ